MGKTPALIAKLQQLWQTPALMVRAPALTAKNYSTYAETPVLMAKPQHL